MCPSASSDVKKTQAGEGSGEFVAVRSNGLLVKWRVFCLRCLQLINGGEGQCIHKSMTNVMQWSGDPLTQGFSTGIPWNPRVPRDVATGSARDCDWKKNKHRFLNLLAKINRSTENYHSLLKRALTIIGLLYLQLTDHANVPWVVDIIFMQGFPDTWKLFQGFLLVKKIEKGCPNHYTTHKWLLTNNGIFPLWMRSVLTYAVRITHTGLPPTAWWADGNLPSFVYIRIVLAWDRL
jgi:hypothetical protein